MRTHLLFNFHIYTIVVYYINVTLPHLTQPDLNRPNHTLPYRILSYHIVSHEVNMNITIPNHNLPNHTTPHRVYRTIPNHIAFHYFISLVNYLNIYIYILLNGNRIRCGMEYALGNLILNFLVNRWCSINYRSLRLR